MDGVLVKRGLDFTRKRKKWIIMLGLVGFSSYGLYKVYHMPSVARKRKRVMKLFGAIISLAEMVSDSAETFNVVSRDLNEFLKSDSDEIPNSLKQLSKITCLEEFTQSASRVFQALTVGILQGYKVENNRNEIQEPNLTDRVMDKLMSSAGTGFVSVIVGSFARNLVMGFYSNSGSNYLNNESELKLGSSSSSLPEWLSLITDDKCRVVIADCIKTFVSTAITIYLDKTMNINVYDDMFSGLTNPKHQDRMKDVLISLCNGAVETLVRTSHQVLTTSKQNTPVSRSNNSYILIDRDQDSIFERDNVRNQSKGSSWVSSVSSTLAVPSNRKFVLDLTGRVTFETVRSIIEVFVLKLSEAMKRSVNVVRDEAVERGFELVRYVGAKSSVILTICFALFLHILGNALVLLPA